MARARDIANLINSGTFLTPASANATYTTKDENALVHIESDIFTATSAININNVFTSTFDFYKVLISLVATSGTPGIWIRLRGGGTDSTGANYSRNFINRRQSDLDSGQSINQTGFLIFDVSTVNAFWEVDIINPFKAQTTGLRAFCNQNFSNTVDNRFAVQGGAHQVSSSFDGLTIYSDNQTVTGNFSIFGFSKG